MRFFRKKSTRRGVLLLSITLLITLLTTFMLTGCQKIDNADNAPLTFTDILGKIDDFVWGIPLIVLILAAGILLTVRVGVLQVHKLPLALKYMFDNEEDGEGEVSSFGALCTALSATIGTGNIVGVATAIAGGGPGALFWMEFAVMLFTRGLMPQKIAVGAGIIVSLIAIFGFFPDGKCNGTVGIAFFNYPDQMDDAFICIIAVFSTL